MNLNMNGASSEEASGHLAGGGQSGDEMEARVALVIGDFDSRRDDGPVLAGKILTKCSGCKPVGGFELSVKMTEVRESTFEGNLDDGSALRGQKNGCFFKTARIQILHHAGARVRAENAR